MKLFGHPDSGHAYKVRLMLTIADIAHDYEHVDIFSPRISRSTEFQTNARYGEVPLLLDAGVAHTQSNAILLHLAQKTGRWGAEHGSTLQLCHEWLFWEANKIGMCLPQLRADRLFSDSKLSGGVRDWLLKRYQHDVMLLDDHLRESSHYMLGTEPTVADFSLCGYLFYAEEAAVTVPNHVQAWLERLSELPGWRSPRELLAISET